MALHVKLDMRSTPINPQTNPALYQGNEITLEGMQELVGGYIQVVNLRHHVNVDGKVYVAIGMNEDGKQMGLSRNTIATELGRKYGAIGLTDCIVGNVILFEAHELVEDAA